MGNLSQIWYPREMYGLGFISRRDEEYDFCIPKTKFKTPAVQEFIKTIKSDEFRDKLLQLGGFMITSDIGREFPFWAGECQINMNTDLSSCISSVSEFAATCLTMNKNR